jgi:hypothetical protein
MWTSHSYTLMPAALAIEVCACGFCVDVQLCLRVCVSSLGVLLFETDVPPNTHCCRPSMVAAVFSLGHSKLGTRHRQVAAATTTAAPFP